MLVNEDVPPADAADLDDWRAEQVGRYTTVSGFLKVLPKVISTSGITPRPPTTHRPQEH